MGQGNVVIKRAYGVVTCYAFGSILLWGPLVFITRYFEVRGRMFVGALGGSHGLTFLDLDFKVWVGVFVWGFI